MAKMLAKAHRHNGGCGRPNRCCRSTKFFNAAGRGSATIRSAQRAHEKQEFLRDLKEYQCLP